MSKLDRLCGTNQTASQKLVSVSFDHSFEIDVILFFLDLLLLLYFLVFISQEIKHLIVRVFGCVYLEIHDSLVLGKRADLLDHLVILF